MIYIHYAKSDDHVRMKIQIRKICRVRYITFAKFDAPNLPSPIDNFTPTEYATE